MPSSSMLEQAVIDAKSLKEAAVKTAEDELLKKYSSQIKEAVENLLEQDPDPLTLEDPDQIEETPSKEERLVQELELKAFDGEKNSDLEEGEMVEINLTELKEELKEEIQDGGQVKEGTKKGQVRKHPSRPDDPFAYEDEPGDEIGDTVVEEEIELSEDDITQAIEEILKVDYEFVPRGNMGTTHPTQAEQNIAVDAYLASSKDSENAERIKELEDAIEKLDEQVKSISFRKNKINEDYNNLKKVALKAAQKLEELNFSNAKLLYQNRILESHSLNERQKQKLVESISNANSIKETKIIFETLNESIGSKSSTGPSNLSEVVSKNTQLILKSNKQASETSESTNSTFRLKKLAGII